MLQRLELFVGVLGDDVISHDIVHERAQALRQAALQQVVLEQSGHRRSNGEPSL